MNMMYFMNMFLQVFRWRCYYVWYKH